MTAASDQFEAVTRRIFHKLAEYFGLEHVEGSRQYSAQDSGVLRQIDITAYRIDGGMVLIECKRHNRPLTIDKVMHSTLLFIRMLVLMAVFLLVVKDLPMEP